MSCTVKFEVMRDNYPLQIGYWDRRKMLFGLGLGAGAFLTPGLFAESLMEPTPRQTEGPFYPDKMPLDTDNDLLVIGDSSTVMYESAFLKTPIRFFNSWMLDNYYEELNIRNSQALKTLLEKKQFFTPDEILKDIYRIFFVGLFKERISFI